MATDYRNTEIPPSTSSFGTTGALVYELFTVRHCAGCRPNFLMPTPPSPALPSPALQLKLVFVIERIHDQPQLCRIGVPTAGGQKTTLSQCGKGCCLSGLCREIPGKR